MEIHRPKPWHSARELLKEIGIIVVGVLIALGGEQIVRSFDQRLEANEARRMLRTEIAANAGDAQHDLEGQRCASVGLDMLASWATGGPRPPVPTSDSLFVYTPHTSAWEVVKAGAAAHMPIEERLAYTEFYDSAHIVTINTDFFDSEMIRVAGLSSKATLAPAEAQRLLEDIGAVRAISAFRVANMQSLVRAAKAAGVAPAPLTARAREQLAAACSPVGLKPTARTP